MVTVVARRSWHAFIVLFLVSLIVFALAHATGDPVRMMVSEYASEADVQRLRHELHLDQPLYVQYVEYLTHAAQGNLGVSLRYQRPAVGLIRERLEATVELAAAALFVALFVSLPAGILAATRRNSWLDYASRLLAVIGQSVPFFWLAIMLILYFSVYLGWLPTSGRGGVSHLILPAVTLATYPMVRIMRLIRSGMLDVLQQDYIRTARAKGLAHLAVLARHALRNAVLPVVTVVGLQTGELLGGAVITETIFAWPGLGLLAIDAVQSRDYPLIQAIVLFISMGFVLINLLVDLSYAYLDPRIRFQ
jgi:peptide/nickel transport system permease protein